jgi:hypothetical protein
MRMFFFQFIFVHDKYTWLRKEFDFYCWSQKNAGKNNFTKLSWLSVDQEDLDGKKNLVKIFIPF